jgi:hypothetical protein
MTPFVPSEWSMEIGLDSNGHVQCYYAEVMRHKQRMCRLCLASENISEEVARKTLTDKAQAWIAEFTSRPPAGDTTNNAVSKNASHRAPPSE